MTSYARRYTAAETSLRQAAWQHDVGHPAGGEAHALQALRVLKGIKSLRATRLRRWAYLYTRGRRIV